MTERDAFAEGADARLAGKPETSNPYAGVDEAAEAEWYDGWASIDVDEDD